MMRPKGFRLGANGSFALPIGENLDETYGYSAGISGMIDFNENLRLTADFAYRTLTLITDDPNNISGILEVPAHDPDFEFQKAVGDQQSIQVGFGLQYLFNVNKRFRPFLGASYNALSLQPYEIEYYFERQSDGGETILPRDVQSSGLIKNLAVINAGIEMNLMKNIHFQTEAFYRRNMSGEAALVPNIWGVQGRLMYKF